MGLRGCFKNYLSAKPRKLRANRVAFTLPYVMNTLQEIERAADALPRQEQEVLLHHLSAKLRLRPSSGWPVPPPAVPREEVRRAQAEIDARFSQVEDAG